MNPMIPKNMAMIKVIQAVQRQPLLKSQLQYSVSGNPWSLQMAHN
jgi:hypothetical protein